MQQQQQQQQQQRQMNFNPLKLWTLRSYVTDGTS